MNSNVIINLGIVAAEQWINSKNQVAFKYLALNFSLLNLNIDGSITLSTLVKSVSIAYFNSRNFTIFGLILKLVETIHSSRPSVFLQ